MRHPKIIKAATKLAIIAIALTISITVGVYFLWQIPLFDKGVEYYLCAITVLLIVCFVWAMVAIIQNFAYATQAYIEKNMDSFWYKY